MEFQDVLEKRRSIRKYQKKDVKEEDIHAMIEAAILAPSWKNSQVTRYYVASSPKAIQLVKDALPEFNQQNVENAPVLIVTTIVSNRSGFHKDGTPCNELENGWGYYDCGLQNMNLLLKATQLGLSTLVMGIRDAKAIRDAFDIPKQESIVSVIAVGYGDILPIKPKRKSVDDITKFY